MVFFLFRFWWEPQCNWYKFFPHSIPRWETTCFRVTTTALTNKLPHAGTQQNRILCLICTAVYDSFPLPRLFPWCLHSPPGPQNPLHPLRGNEEERWRRHTHFSHTWSSVIFITSASIPFRRFHNWLGLHAKKTGKCGPSLESHFPETTQCNERRS